MDKMKNSLKEASVKRLMLDMINDVQNSSGAKESLVVMIVDKELVKILSSIVTMSELIEKGVFSLEKLEIQRERFPKFHGLYFISPNEESINAIIKDFSGTQPQYSRAHIFFSQACPQPLLAKISSHENLMKRLKTCKEVNFSFFLRDLNLFDLGFNAGLNIFATRSDENSRNTIISQIADKLFTACAVMNEYPYIQYPKNSYFSAQLANILFKKFQDFYSKKSFNEKRGILLLLDRDFDPIAPLLHDFYYETMVHDLFNVRLNVIDYNKTTYKFDEKDKLWMKYRNKHIAEVLGEIQKDFNAFLQSDISKIQRGQDDESANDVEQMQKLMHGMKGYQLESKQFSMHLNLADELNNKYKEFNELVNLEQDIINGFTNKGQPVERKDIINAFALIGTKISPNDKLRLLLSLHASIDFDEKNFYKMAESFGFNESQMKPVINLKWLGINFEGNKGRRDNSRLNEKIAEYQTNAKGLQYNIVRSNPKIQSIVYGSSNFTLSKNDFIYTEQPERMAEVNKGHALKQNFGSVHVSEKKPVMIVFVIGGIARNEICAIERLENEKKLNHHVVIGSTSILYGNDYVDSLTKLPSNNEEVSGFKAIQIKVE